MLRLTSRAKAIVIKTADPAIPISPTRCRDLRPARSTTNSYTNKQEGWGTRPVSTAFFKYAHIKTLYCTHRHHSESCVNYTSSNGGIDRLLNSSLLKDASGVVEDLKSTTTTETERENFPSSFSLVSVSFLQSLSAQSLAWTLTALMPDSCWESCRTRAITRGWR